MKSHLPALDGIRGLAILAVVLSHCAHLFSSGIPRELEIKEFLFLGGLGVDLFFVLSGFLITGVLIDSKGTTGYFRNFYFRRILRIFPAYYLYLFSSYFFLHPNVTGMNSTQLLWQAAFLTNWLPNLGLSPQSWSHLWSLCVEEQFYLFWPLVVFLCPRRLLSWVCGVGIVTAVILRYQLVVAAVEWEVIHRWTPVRLDSLLWGSLGAVAFRHPIRKAQWLRVIPYVAGMMAVLFVTQVLDLAWTRTAVGATSTETICAILFSSLVFWAAEGRWGSHWLTARPLRLIGQFSYGIYLWHGQASQFLVWHPRGISLKLLGMAGLTVIGIGLGWVSWKFWEAPFLRLKRYFAYSSANEGV